MESTTPINSYLFKRLRALKKKVQHIQTIEQKLEEGAQINQEQQEALKGKPALIAQIDELNKLQKQIPELLQQEKQAFVQQSGVDKVEQKTQTVEDNSSEKEDVSAVQSDERVKDIVAKLTKLLYLSKVWSQRQNLGELEQNSLLSYSPKFANGQELEKSDIQLVVQFSQLITEKQGKTPISHLDALKLAEEQALKYVLDISKENASLGVQYSYIQDVVDAALSSGYSTVTPKAQVEVHTSIAQTQNPAPQQNKAAAINNRPTQNLAGQVRQDDAGLNVQRQEAPKIAPADDTEKDVTSHTQPASAQEIPQQNNSTEDPGKNIIDQLKKNQLNYENKRKTEQQDQGYRKSVPSQMQQQASVPSPPPSQVDAPQHIQQQQTPQPGQNNSSLANYVDSAQQSQNGLVQYPPNFALPGGPQQNNHGQMNNPIMFQPYQQHPQHYNQQQWPNSSSPQHVNYNQQLQQLQYLYPQQFQHMQQNQFFGQQHVNSSSSQNPHQPTKSQQAASQTEPLSIENTGNNNSNNNSSSALQNPPQTNGKYKPPNLKADIYKPPHHEASQKQQGAANLVGAQQFRPGHSKQQQPQESQELIAPIQQEDSHSKIQQQESSEQAQHKDAPTSNLDQESDPILKDNSVQQREFQNGRSNEQSRSPPNQYRDRDVGSSKNFRKPYPSRGRQGGRQYGRYNEGYQSYDNYNNKYGDKPYNGGGVWYDNNQQYQPQYGRRNGYPYRGRGGQRV